MQEIWIEVHPVKINKISRVLFFLIALVCVTTPAGRSWCAEASDSPLATIRTSVDSILGILKEQGAGREDKRARIRAIVLDRFDFVEMSRRVLGTNWKEMTPEERDAFVERFKRLLEATYVNKIEAYTDEKVVFGRETIEGKYAKVESTALTKTADIPIHYTLIKKGDGWFVYDVVIENVSLVSNFRTTYAEIIKSKGVPRLFEEMDAKIRELESNNGNPKG